MKKFLLIALTAVFIISCETISGHQTETLETYESIFESEGKKDELYLKSNKWMVETFKSSKSVIQFSDKESGMLIGKYIVKPANTVTGLTGDKLTRQSEVSAIITLQLKDNRAKISIAPNDYEVVPNAQGITPKQDIIDRIEYLINNYEYYLKNDSSMDW